MGRRRSYTDRELIDAIATARSWRGALRRLGLTATSAGAMRSVRANADRLGADYGHFTGQRQWTEEGLRAAIAAASTWADVVHTLGLRGGSRIALVKGHALRLGLETAHLTDDVRIATDSELRPDRAQLDRAGSLLAAAWYTLCGCDVSWPLEPSRYDLLVDTHQGIRRVQVKTSRARVGDSWKVFLSTARGERRTYDPDEIDEFFVIDGDLNFYVIPVASVGGLHAIHLSAYGHHRVYGDAVNGWGDRTRESED